MTEVELIKNLEHQDPQAVKVLVETYQNKITSLCYRFLQNREDAEDTAQEVFIECLGSIPHFRGECKLSTWIYQIAVSKSLDYIRKSNRKKRVATIQSLFFKSNRAEQIAASGEKQPEYLSEKEESLKLLQDTVNSLSRNQRIAITLNKIEGFTNKEVGEIMALSLSSVDSLLHRAKQNLRKKLYNYYDKKL